MQEKTVPSVSQFLAADHRRCDELFASAELAAQKNKWEECEHSFHAFLSAMKHHFSMEEQVLFPTIAGLNPQISAPIEVMLMEHEQVNNLIEQMEEAVDAKNTDDYLGASDTLLNFMQQHNMKEEQILYTMADHILGSSGPEVVQRMEELIAA